MNKMVEITDDQQASLEDIPQIKETNKYVIPPELFEAEQLRKARKPDEAFKLCVTFMNDHLDHVPAMVLAANIMIESERYGLAHPLLVRCAQMEPDKAVVWNNLGFLHSEAGNFVDAEKVLMKCVSIDPNYALGWNSLSNVYVRLGEPEKAVRCADKAMELDQRLPECRFNKSLAKLMLGEWKEGWEGYDFNLGRHQGRRERIYGIIPRWTGVDGLTLIAYGEQGIGDEIAFASCIPDLQKKNEVIIECNAKSRGLFERSFGCKTYGTLTQKGIGWPVEHKIDASVAMGSLPGFYRNSTEDFPGTPYLKADPDRRLQWRALLDKLGPKKKIGIAWTGGIKKTGDKLRSMKLNDLEPILRQDATFICLQYKDASAEIAELYAKKGLIVHQWSHATLTADYDDTAALVAELDLVITVTTAVVDLAGGLGVPCWVMVPRKPIWRFGPEAYPWAKSVKLYRQYREDWLNTVAEIAHDLRALCSQSSAS